MEKVSVIIPVYNVEKYLDACMDSVVNQTYRELEIIAVDDGSTDKSGDILDEWEKKDSRILVIHKENGGISSARNAALDVATGDYIAMIDSDDFWDSDAVEHLLLEAKNNEADMVIAQGRRVDCEGNLYSENRKDIAIHGEGIISENEFWERRLKNMFFVVAWSKLYRKEIFSNIRFPEGQINEDVAILWKVIHACKKIYVSEKMIYNWRVNPTSITRSGFSYRNLNLANLLLTESEYITNANVSDKIKYLTKANAFSYTVDILSKAYKSLNEQNQINEADEIYRQYKPIAKELKKNVRLSEKNHLLVSIQMTLFCVSKSGYFAFRNIIKRGEE